VRERAHDRSDVGTPNILATNLGRRRRPREPYMPCELGHA
jgi:hypothetical protein